MTDAPTVQPEPDYRARFLGLLRTSLDRQGFVKLVLGKYRGQEAGLKRILVRQVTVQGQSCLSLVSSYQTRDVTRNVPVAAGVETIGQLLGDPFLSAHLFSLADDVQVEFSRKGRCRWSRSEPSCRVRPSKTHDRAKERFLDPRRPFLVDLGVTEETHRVRPSMARKWKQINKFLELFQHAFESSKLPGAQAVQVVDFGSGKGYLTFAIHDLLRGTLEVEAQVTGIELREDLVCFCNGVVEKLGLDGLGFRQGDVRSYTPEALQVMIALHACDTATDQALYMGIRAGAEIIMCAPCCHKQIRPQMHRPTVLEPLLQFGLHLGQEAEMVTDTLRALLLEAHGYRTQLLEFVSLEHTSKNKMLLGVRHDSAVDREGLLAKIAALKEFYGIRTHSLETLLLADGAPAGP